METAKEMAPVSTDTQRVSHTKADDTVTTTALVDWPVVRSAEDEHAALFGALNNMVRLRDVVLDRLPLLTDDQLLQMWQYVREWGVAAWLIQCAICAEEKRRADRQYGGRARPDTSGVGVSSAVSRRAAEMGVTPRTVYRYAQIYETFFAPETTDPEISSFMPLLDEVSYWSAALHAPEPRTAIALLAERKADDAFYAPRDARDDVERLRQAERERLRAEAPSADVPCPGAYRVLYADPPWRYQDSTTSPNRFIENHYPTMDLEEICALPVAEWAAPDAILFLWATSPKLEEALQVMRAWDFTYRTNIVWVKDKIGLGHWVRQQHELLLIGRRGDFPTPHESVRPASVIEAPRGVHSAKPEQVYEMIEAMYPDQPALEVFARTQRAGWTAFGNEVACS